MENIDLSEMCVCGFDRSLHTGGSGMRTWPPPSRDDPPCAGFKSAFPQPPSRGYLGGGTVGGGDHDDADREPECEECRGAERPCAKCIPTTPAPDFSRPRPMTEAARLKAKEAIRRLRARHAEIYEEWLNKMGEAHGLGQECERGHVLNFLRQFGFYEMARAIEERRHLP